MTIDMLFHHCPTCKEDTIQEYRFTLKLAEGKYQADYYACLNGCGHVRSYRDVDEYNRLESENERK